MNEELQAKIAYLGDILGTDKKVKHNGGEYTVSGLMQKRIRGQKVISVELTPCNGADSLTYCRVQDIERGEE